MLENCRGGRRGRELSAAELDIPRALIEPADLRHKSQVRRHSSDDTGSRSDRQAWSNTAKKRVRPHRTADGSLSERAGVGLGRNGSDIVCLATDNRSGLEELRFHISKKPVRQHRPGGQQQVTHGRPETV